MIDDQRVQPPVHSDRADDQLPALVRSREFLLDRSRPGTLPDQGLGLRPSSPVAKDHARPGRGEQAHALRANTPRPAGDQRNFPFN